MQIFQNHSIFQSCPELFKIFRFLCRLLELFDCYFLSFNIILIYLNKWTEKYFSLLVDTISVNAVDWILVVDDFSVSWVDLIVPVLFSRPNNYMNSFVSYLDLQKSLFFMVKFQTPAKKEAEFSIFGVIQIPLYNYGYKCNT